MRKTFILMCLLTSLLLAAASPASAQAPLPSPLAYAGSDGNIFLIGTDGQVTQITTDGHMRAEPSLMEDEIEYHSLKWSPDGRTLAAVREERLYTPQQLFSTSQVVLYDLDSASLQQLGKDYPFFTWKPDSRGLVYFVPISGWSNKGPVPPFKGIWEYNLDSQQEFELIPARSAPLTLPAYSNTGRYMTFYEVIAMEGLGYFARFDFQSNQYRAWNQPTDRSIGSLNWSSRDTFVVFDENTYTPLPESQVFRADPDFNNVVAISPRVPGRNHFSPRLSPSGELVASLSDSINEGGYSTIWVYGIDGSSAREVFAPNSSIYSFGWSPDNRSLFVISGDYLNEQIQLIDVETRQVLTRFAGRSVAWQPGSPVPAPLNTEAPVPTREPAPTVLAYTATPITAQSTPVVVPVDRVLPPAPTWMTGTVFLVLLCGGVAGLGLIVVVVILLLRRKG